MRFVDDVELVGKTLKEVNERLEELRTATLEGKGLRISRSKTKTMVYDFEKINREMDRARNMIVMGGECDLVCKVKRFKCLESAVQKKK